MWAIQSFDVVSGTKVKADCHLHSAPPTVNKRFKLLLMVLLMRFLEKTFALKKKKRQHTDSEVAHMVFMLCRLNEALTIWNFIISTIYFLLKFKYNWNYRIEMFQNVSRTVWKNCIFQRVHESEMWSVCGLKSLIWTCFSWIIWLTTWHRFRPCFDCLPSLKHNQFEQFKLISMSPFFKVSILRWLIQYEQLEHIFNLF